MKPARKDTLETRQNLVDAAEKLFAERGIENVTLLDIGRAAGQKNRNAPQYHFGDKAGLVNAVLDKHTDLIAERRAAMLKDLKDQESLDVAALVRVFVLPVAEHVATTKNSHAFLQINAQLMTSPTLKELPIVQRATTMPEVKEMSRLFDAVLPTENPGNRRGKILLMRSMLYHGLASFYTQHPQDDPSSFVDALCAGIVAVLMNQARPEKRQ
jgi:AcrR family transcriptional regulator